MQYDCLTVAVESRFDFSVIMFFWRTTRVTLSIVAYHPLCHGNFHFKSKLDCHVISIIKMQFCGHKLSDSWQGERATWEKMAALRANCGTELTIDHCLAKLATEFKNQKLAQARSANSSFKMPQRSLLKARTPSWINLQAYGNHFFFFFFFFSSFFWM